MFCPRLSALAVALAGLAGVLPASAPPAAADPEIVDPVYVFYPRGSCREERIELEVWDREERVWRDHPRHPQVPIESCQLEDAGILLQEIRWRCIETRPVDPPPTWVVGLNVFDPGVMERCAVDARSSPDGVEIRISSPEPGTTLRNAAGRAEIAGSVHVGGARGARYDVVIALDVSQATGARSDGPELFGAQLDAAADLVSRLRHRLGSVRIGVVSFPNLQLSPGDPGGTGARREVPLTDDPRALDRALRSLRSRRPDSFQSFASGLAFALRELLGDLPGSGARSDARKVLIVSADGRGDRPFGPAAAESSRYREKVQAASQRLREAGVEAHFFALGGIAGDAPDLLREAIGSQGSFRRVPEPRLGSAFLQLVSLPYVTEVVVTDLRTGEVARDLELAPDGRFEASVPVERGANPVLVTAVTSEGLRGERELVIDFDDGLIQEALLEAERERIRKIREQRRGRVEVRPDVPDAARP